MLFELALRLTRTAPETRANLRFGKLGLLHQTGGVFAKITASKCT
jgi:hypothetical protein